MYYITIDYIEGYSNVSSRWTGRRCHLDPILYMVNGRQLLYLFSVTARKSQTETNYNHHVHSTDFDKLFYNTDYIPYM